MMLMRKTPSVCRTSVIRLFSSSQEKAKFDLFNPSEDHVALRDMVSQFTREKVEPQAQLFNKEETFNIPLFRECGQLGLLGLTVEEKYGGSLFSDHAASAVVAVHEELSSSDPAFCLSYLAHSLLFTNNLAINGSDAQKERFLPSACDGSAICGMAMSEPHAGTDVLGMKTNAKFNKTTNSYILNGIKMWITNGAIDDDTLGDVFLVYARTNNTGRASEDFSTFLVEKQMKGFSLGQRVKDKLGMRASMTAEIVFEDVEVPVENLVGKEGKGVLSMMRNLEIERLGLAGMSLGIARRSLEIMVQYAQERNAFGGQSLTKFGQIQRHIGEGYANYNAGRAYVYNTARMLDLNSAGNRVATDGVKLFCGEMAKTVADSAIQTLGGNGYVGEYVVERLWRDSKLLEIGGGTNESHHKNITNDLQRHGL